MLNILRRSLDALDHIDEVIRIIRASETDAEAQAELMSKFKLSERSKSGYSRYASSSFDWFGTGQDSKRIR